MLRATRSTAPCGITAVSQPLPCTRNRSSHTTRIGALLHAKRPGTFGPHGLSENTASAGVPAGVDGDVDDEWRERPEADEECAATVRELDVPRRGREWHRRGERREEVQAASDVARELIRVDVESAEAIRAEHAVALVDELALHPQCLGEAR